MVFMKRTGLRRLGGRHGVLVGLLVLAVLAIGVLVAVRGAGGSTDDAAAPSRSTGGAAGGEAAGDAVGGAAGPVGAAPAPGVAGAPAEPGSAPPTDPAAVPVGGVARSLVRTAQLGVLADDPVAVTRRVRTAVAGVSGTIAQETSSDTGAQLTVRVPTDRLDQLIDSIGGLGRVTNRSAQVVDATEDVVDLDARVASQRASVDRVRALLAQARSVGDVVSIESELTRREADLDSLTGRRAALKDQVALSTLTVDLEKAPVTTEPVSGPTGFVAGWAAGWDGLKVVAVAAGAALGYLLPFVPVLAVLLGLGWLGRRAARSRRTPQPASGTEGPGI